MERWTVALLASVVLVSVLLLTKSSGLLGNTARTEPKAPEVLRRRQGCHFDKRYRETGIDFNGLVQQQVGAGFPLAVEVGAYDGKDAFDMTQRGAEVYSFEASALNFQRCLKNYPPEQHPKLKFVHAAASGEAGTLKFYDDGGTGACVGCQTGRAKAEQIEVRSLALESSKELKDRIGEVGAMKFDTQGHEPVVFQGMQNWIKSAKAPPIIQFEFDVCLMKSAGRTPSEVVAFLQSLVDAGYTLSDGRVSDWESKVYALESLKAAGKLQRGISLDGALANSTLKERVEEEAKLLASRRPTACAEVVEWYCPKGRKPQSPRTYTDIVASKPRRP